MYLQRYGLRALPFRLSPDCAFLYPALSHSQALEALRDMLAGPGGVTLLTGPDGVGKTTVIDRLLLEVPLATAVARLNQGLPTAIALLQGLLMQFGYAPFHLTRAELGSALHTFLAERNRAQENTLVIVDEAQRLELGALVELLEATNPYGTRVHLVLVGTSDLNDRLASTAAMALQAAIRLRVTLSPLRPDEVARYLQHRLDTAGGGGRRVFEDGAVDMLSRITAGLPKQLNKLADGAMTAAFEDVRDVVRTDDVLAASRLLGTIEQSLRRAAPVPAPIVPAAAAPPQEPAAALPDAATQAKLSPSAAADVASEIPTAPFANEPMTAAVTTQPVAVAESPPAITPMATPSGEVSEPPDAAPESPAVIPTLQEISAVAAAVPVYRVHVRLEDELIHTVQLLPGELRIGRTRDNDLQIESRYVSRHHCRLVLSRAGLSVEDLGSTNGLRVNGTRERRRSLAHGDVVTVGQHELRVEVVPEAD